MGEVTEDYILIDKHEAEKRGTASRGQYAFVTLKFISTDSCPLTRKYLLMFYKQRIGAIGT